MKRKAFSLMELLVVVGVFSLLLLVVSSVFISISASQRLTIQRHKTLVDLNFALEQIAQTVRQNNVLYQYYDPADQLVNGFGILYLVDNANNWTAYRASEIFGCPSIDGSKCLIKWYGTSGGPAASEIVSPRDLNITKLNFYIYPFSDPNVFDPATNQYKSDNQVLVTINIEAERITDNPAEKEKTNLQTTVATRYYAR